MVGRRSRGWRSGRLVGLVAVALVAATLTGVGGAPASAQGATCFGRTPTIIAQPGRVTVGTSGPDVILGTSGPDVIRGRGGNDRICGRGGADVISGGKGDDRIDGGKGGDRLEGNSGRDLLRGRSGRDDLRGGKGRDELEGGKGRDDLRGGTARDVCTGGSARDDVRSCDEVSVNESFFLPSVCLFDAAVWSGGEHPDNGSAEVFFAEGGVAQAIAIDLDGDGRRGRARLIWCSFGGTAVARAIYLHDDSGNYLGTLPVEDAARTFGGVSPSIVGADGRELILSVLGYDVRDPTCCPSLQTDLRYRWAGGPQLREFDGARGMVGSASDVRDRFVDRWNAGDMAALREIASPAAIDTVRIYRTGSQQLSPGFGSCDGGLCLMWPAEPFQFFVLYLDVVELANGRVVISDVSWGSTN